jgi:predicted site-specific integrase-resolvase
MIGYTVPQAAERVGRDVQTIRRWIREGRLSSILGVDGHRYVWENDLLDAERDARQAQRFTRFAYPQVSTACAIVKSRSVNCTTEPG